MVIIMAKKIKRNGKMYTVREEEITREDVLFHIEQLEKQLLILQNELWELDQL